MFIHKKRTTHFLDYHNSTRCTNEKSPWAERRKAVLNYFDNYNYVARETRRYRVSYVVEFISAKRRYRKGIF